MEFSEPFNCTKNICSFSPDGKFVAAMCQQKLIIRLSNTLASVKSFNCSEKIDYIEWSPDSLLVLCASYAHKFVQVFSIENPSWLCKITEGAAGLVKACWSPDSRNILTTGTFHIQVSIWSLSDESVSYIHYTKEGNPGMAFSADGLYLAVLERRGVKDYVLILPCSTWTPFLRLECNGFMNTCGLAWYPDDSGICVWESPPEEGLKIFWLEGGSQEGLPATKTPKTLGVRCVEWSPSAQFLAFGANDGKVQLLNTITWCRIASFFHEEIVSSQDCDIYCELMNTTTGTSKTKYELLDKQQVNISKVKRCTSKMPLSSKMVINPHGVRRISFCPSGAWIFSQDDSCPSVLWIWSISRLKLKTVLIQNQPVTDAAWSPVGDGTLVFCTGNVNVSFWTPKGGPVIIRSGIPEKITRVKWHPSGKSLLLLGHGEAILCLIRDSESDKSKK